MIGWMMITSILLVSWLMVPSNADDKCKEELKRCLATTPLEGPIGLPATLNQIVSLCTAYNSGMDCVDKWNKQCLPVESRAAAEKKMASVKFFMNLLCQDQEFRKEYLNHTECFGGVSHDWVRCHGVFKETMVHINERGSLLTSAEKTLDICCARFGFNRCISNASKAKCDVSGAIMLRRISETLTHNDQCERFDNAICSASSIYIISNIADCLLTILSSYAATIVIGKRLMGF